MENKSREYVNEHAIANERAHRVAARKTPALVSEERGRVFRSWAADHELEDVIEEAASREGGDPTAEDDPLASDREEESSADCHDDHRHERANQADRVEHGVPSGGGMRMHPVEQGHVEQRERIMMDDVFRDAPEEPQPREANEEANRQMQPQVFTARKACGHERPSAWKARLESLEAGPPEGPLPQELGAFDERSAVPLKPAPPEHECDDQSDEERSGEAGLSDIVLELRQVAAEDVAKGAKDYGPAYPPQGVIEHEGAVGHAGRSCEHRGPGAQQRDEAT